MRLELRATPQEVMRAVETFQQFGRERKVPGKILFGLAVALEECGSNIVRHALRGNARRKFRVSLKHTRAAVTIELRDRGPAFDPTRMPVAAVNADDDRPPGGWGIQLVRQFTDVIRYTRARGENVLRLTKRLRAVARRKARS